MQRQLEKDLETLAIIEEQYFDGLRYIRTLQRASVPEVARDALFMPEGELPICDETR